MADDDKPTYPRLFMLTELTGKKSQEDRTVPMWGIEFARRHIAILAISSIPALMVTGLTFPFLGIYSAFLFVAVIIGAFFLVEWRSRKGLKQRLYRTVYDKATAIDSEFILCGQRVPLTNYSPGIIYRSCELTQVSHREVALLETERPGVTAGTDSFDRLDMFSVAEGEVSLEAEYFTTSDIPHSQSQSASASPKTRKQARSEKRRKRRRDRTGNTEPNADGIGDIFDNTSQTGATTGIAQTTGDHTPAVPAPGNFDDLEL